MDSPERTEIVSSSSPVQGSPFFNYLSRLSPIKAIKVSNIAQGFSELRIPTPPPVFTSPRINPPRETDLLKRPDTEKFLIEYDDRGKILKWVPSASRGSISQSMIELSPCVQKECNNKEARESAPCTPLGGIEEYLADPLEGADISDSSKSCLKKNIDPLQESQSGCTSSKGTIGIDDDVWKDTKTEVASTLASSVQAEEDPVGENSLGHVQQVAAEGNGKLDISTVQQIDKRLTENGNYLIEVGSSMEPASDTRVDKHLVDQTAAKNLASHMSGDEELEISNCRKEKPECPSELGRDGTQKVTMQLAESGQGSGCVCSQEAVSESFHSIAGDDDHNENSGAITNGSVENQMPHDCKEVGQHQRGMRRRLQFEAAEAHRKNSGSHGTSSNPVTNARSTASPVHLATLNASHAESIENSSNHQSVDFSQHSSSRLPLCPHKMPEPLCDKVDKSSQNKGISRITAAMPSGIGLHLNSIGNAGAMSCSSNVKSAEKDHLSVQEKSISLSNHQLTEDSESCLVSNSLTVTSMSSDSPLDYPVVKNTEEDRQESQATMMVNSSANFHSPQSMKPFNNSMPLMNTERRMIPYEMKRSASEDSCNVEEFSQMSPRKKRKRAPNTSENEGCKRCNCKKSKCLKLYCDCFAAGVYCAEPCACLECFNKPEYEDTVLGTRQQIESRNPLAFAPKVVRRVTESPANSGEDSSRVTPASARHKRGCNCKKSMCLKKYCECYQAGVGCAEGCRCEGCKNIFGTKGRSMDIAGRIYRRVEDDEWGKEISDGKLDRYEVRRDTLRPEQPHPQNLSPLTPLFQSSNHGRDAPEYRLPTRRYLPSPESDTSVLSSYGKSLRSPGNLNSNNRHMKAREGNSNIVPYDLEMDCHDIRKVDEFSPGWDGLVDLCDLTPLPLPPPRTASATSESKGCMNVSRAPHMSHGSSRRLSVGSLRWRGSPVTPIPLCSGTKLLSGSDSESVLYNIPEGETPEILKDTHTPIKTVKASSPNQKRVSPPYNGVHESRRSSSSPGLKSGRKFILKSVPSFPPLSPCSDYKDSEK